MKSIFLGLLLAVVAVPAWGAGCYQIEYLELKEMSKNDLIEEYCLAKKEIEGLVADKYNPNIKGFVRDSNSCLYLMKRIDRILKKRAIKEPDCK